jgi:pimeloyl-ACP methyl ester carboxylesterase
MRMKHSPLAFLTLSLLALPARPTGAALPAQPPAPKPLALRPCAAVPGLPAGARCGTYEVFENRAARKGRKIPLRVVVLPALGPERAPDAIVYFAGGPGGSSVEEGVELGEVLQQLHQRRDILLVDMRGTGGSAPLVCPELQGSQGVQGFPQASSTP